MSELIIPGQIETRLNFKKDGLSVERIQDVEPILDFNKRAQADSNFGWTDGRDMRHVALIPTIMLEKWAKEHGLEKREVFGQKMNEIIKKKLNDPDYAYLRTGGGVV